MDKIAQRRGLLNKIREKINAPGKVFEGMFKPELEKVMDRLKKIDDKIRSILTGMKIGEAESPTDTMSAKDLLKKARSNFNRREYMAGVTDLGHFHRKMWDVVQEIKEFDLDTRRIHHKFLFEGLEPGYDDKLDQLKQHMSGLAEKKSSYAEEYMIKEASLWDTLINVITPRGWSLATWEKKYPRETKKLRDDGSRLVDEGQKLLSNTISYLKEMATARATRRPDAYRDAALKIRADFNKFDSGDKGFRSYYATAVKPWLDIQEEFKRKDAEERAKFEAAEKAKEEAAMKPPVTSTTPATSSGDTKEKVWKDIEQRQQQLVRPPFQAPPGNPAPEQFVKQETPTALTPEQEEDRQRHIRSESMVHKRFYDSLESLSQEDPLVLAKYISKYATSIQESDPETAIELFNIVRRVNQ